MSEKFIVVIEDVNTGEVTETECSSYRKAEMLMAAIDFANGENKIVEIYNEKGEKID